MSIESAKAYVERMKTDEEFRKKVLECKDAKARMKLVKAEGFDFSASDINVVSAVLDDAELQNVAGGARDWCKEGYERGMRYTPRSNPFKDGWLNILK